MGRDTGECALWTLPSHVAFGRSPFCSLRTLRCFPPDVALLLYSYPDVVVVAPYVLDVDILPYTHTLPVVYVPRSPNDSLTSLST